MYRAGYDPQAFISFFEKVQALEKRKPGMVEKAFADHPQTPDRILHSQEEIARILPARTSTRSRLRSSRTSRRGWRGSRTSAG